MQSWFCHFQLNGRNSSSNRWPERGRAVNLLRSGALLTGLPWQRSKSPHKQITLSDICGSNSAHVVMFQFKSAPLQRASGTADFSHPSKNDRVGRGGCPVGGRLTDANCPHHFKSEQKSPPGVGRGVTKKNNGGPML